MFIDFDRNALLVGIGILCVLLPLLWWQKRRLSYLLFFSVFWVYLLAVVDVVIFPIAVGVGNSNIAFRANINLIPFYFGGCSRLINFCAFNIIGNIVLTIPFGFGINFLIKIKPKNFFSLAIIVGFVLEFSQLVISLIFRSRSHVIDVNDVILNGTGVIVGYVLFRLFAWTYLKIPERFNLGHKLVFAYVYEVAFQAQVTDKSKNA
jgi:glycopeptide antibiotics resistance protein